MLFQGHIRAKFFLLKSQFVQVLQTGQDNYKVGQLFQITKRGKIITNRGSKNFKGEGNLLGHYAFNLI